MAEREVTAEEAEALLPQFVFERLLNQDQSGRRIALLGTITSLPALLIFERAAFSSTDADLRALTKSLTSIRNIGHNDIYHWYMASTSPSPSLPSSEPNSSAPSVTNPAPPTLKLNLIHPCTPSHVAKYTAQAVHYVLETPEIYAAHVKPFVEAQRARGKLSWVYNILDGHAEQEDILYRHPPSTSLSSLSPSLSTSSNADIDENEGFLLMPDLNWDRTTLSTLHLLALPIRRDLSSIRSLTPTHIPFLHTLHSSILRSISTLYPTLSPTSLKFYFHYQPTYYHLHVHVVHVSCEAGATQGVGKAVGWDVVMGLLEGSGERGLEGVALGYTVGERSELWERVWGPLMEEKGEEV